MVCGPGVTSPRLASACLPACSAHLALPRLPTSQATVSHEVKVEVGKGVEVDVEVNIKNNICWID